MKSIIDIFEELENTSGSNAKKEILELNRRNDLLKETFVAAQDPYTVYYVNKFKMPKHRAEALCDDDDIIYSFVKEILPQLSSRKVTGNEAKEYVIRQFEGMTELQQKWCQRILLKNLRCGVQEATVNKIWPGTLKSFSVALACTLKSEFIKNEGIKILDVVNYPVRVEPKLDGLRCIVVKQNGAITFFTRNGTILETLPTIKTLLEAASYDNWVLDGEAMAKDWSESTSIIMSSKTKKDDTNLVFNVFDAVPLGEWTTQECTLSYEKRVEFVTGIVNRVDSNHVVQVPHIMAQSEDELNVYFAKCMDEGFEGVMLKTLDTPYVFKRSENIMKLKPCVTYEGVIVGHYEGRRGTKREGLFGGFEVVLPNGVITRLGGGFSDSFKAEVQLNGPDTYVGKIAELEAQPDPMTIDGLSVDGKARFPVFCRLRDERDVGKDVIEAGAKYIAAKKD